MTNKEFRNGIAATLGKKSENVYFSQTATAYYADYRPKYPAKTAGDFLITGNILTGHITMSADTAAVPIIKEYDSFEHLLEALKNVD